MDEEDILLENEDDILLATVTEVTADGVKIRLDGEDAGSEKVYRCNAALDFDVGKRVKITPISGSYVVDYVVGSPKSNYPIPPGGADGQYLVRGASEYTVRWSSGPTVSEVPEIRTSTPANAVLRVMSGTTYGYGWSSVSEFLPSGTPSVGYVVTKTSTGYGWQASEGLPSMAASTSGKYLTNNGVSASWAAINQVPTGGTSGQVLTKTSSGYGWDSASGGLPSMTGKNGKFLTTNGTTASWADVTVSMASTVTITGAFTATGTTKLSGNSVVVGGTGSTARLGFFGTSSPATKQSITTSSTLTQLITALKAYNLI